MTVAEANEIHVKQDSEHFSEEKTAEFWFWHVKEEEVGGDPQANGRFLQDFMWYYHAKNFTVPSLGPKALRGLFPSP